MRYLSVLAVFIAAALPFAAHATSTMKTPYVTKGEGEVEQKIFWRGDSDKSQRNFSTSTEFGYGLTDNWKVKIKAQAMQREGDSYKYSETQFENIFQLTDKGKYWADFGLLLGYDVAARPNSPDNLAGRFIIAKQIERWKHLLNFNFSHEVGHDADHDLQSGLSWQSLYEWSPTINVGFEYYGDIGRVHDLDEPVKQQHKLGPVLQYEIADSPLSFETAAMMGLTRETSNAELRASVKYKF